MNKLIKGAVDTVPESVKTVIDVEEVLPLPEPESGVSWTTGIGIAAIVLILAAALAKYKCCKK